MEITGIFADKVAGKGVEINPGKAGGFLTGRDGLQGELSASKGRLPPGSRAQLASGQASETDLNFRYPDPRLMVEGRGARNSTPRRDRGHVALARLEREAVSVAVLADIGVAGRSRGEVYDQAAHQRRRLTRERDRPRMVFYTAGVGKFKHLGVLP
jgi:hypothetical protein